MRDNHGYPDLPDTLRERLQALGATDEESVREAIERDPELRQEFEAFLAANQPTIDALVSEAFDRFMGATDSEQLDELAWDIPFILDESFAEMVRRVVGEAQREGDDELAGALLARLEGLENIREQREAAEGSPLIEGLLQFLNAPTDDEARSRFTDRRDVLDSEEAQEAIETYFQGADEDSQRRIEARGALLRTLRAA